MIDDDLARILSGEFKSPILPAWLLERTDRTRVYLVDSANTFHQAMQLVIAHAEGLLLTPQGAPPLSLAEQLRIAEQRQRQLFILQSHSLVSLVSLIDVSVCDLLAAWLEHVPGMWDVDIVSKVKLPAIGDWMTLTTEDQTRWVIKQLLQGSGKSYNPTGTYDRIATAFGIDRTSPRLRSPGDADKPGLGKDMSLALIELRALRNVIVHQLGIVDRAFVEACPHLSLTVGQPIELPAKNYARYASAALQYYSEFSGRVMTSYERLIQAGKV